MTKPTEIRGNRDFAFEVRVLGRFRQYGVRCEHSGTFVDRRTQKIRQFDIRGETRLSGTEHVYLAIETTNVKKPILINSIPRANNESFIDHVYFGPNRSGTHKKWEYDPASNLTSIYRGDNDACWKYWPKEFIGKGIDRLSRDGTLELRAENSEQNGEDKTREKMYQSLASLEDIVYRSAEMLTNAWVIGSPGHSAAFLPVVVVPDGMLYEQKFGHDGPLNEPQPVNESSVYVGMEMYVSDYKSIPYHRPTGTGLSHTLTISHTEFIIESHIENFLKSLRTQTAAPINIFGRFGF